MSVAGFPLCAFSLHPIPVPLRCVSSLYYAVWLTVIILLRITSASCRHKKQAFMTYKSMYKYELANAAGVSSDTFRRWLQSDRTKLKAMGVAPKQHLLPPKAVRYLCEKYDIEVG